MTYENSKKDIVKSGIWTHALSQELELESGALDRSAILTLKNTRFGKHIV